MLLDHYGTGDSALVIAKPSTTGAGFALAAGAPSASTGRLVEGPKPGERGGLVPVGYRIDPPPTEPRWLLIIAVIAALGIAFGAAVIAPTL